MMEAIAAERTTVSDASRKPEGPVVRSLFQGRLRDDLLLPFPVQTLAERSHVEDLIGILRQYAAESIDPRRIEEERWIGDDVVRGMGERGLMGLGVPAEYGGQGLSRTGYCQMFEALGRLDIGFALVIGIHQSIGTRGIVEFGNAEQRERFLPDLAAGRKLAAFALTEPDAGSDAYNISSRAVRQPDGSWLLNGEKCFIGNGAKGSVFVTFARAEVDGRDRHIALILEKGMQGFEHGERFSTLGLLGNDVRRLRFTDVRVPAENVLGEPGNGYRIARRVLETGRLSIAAGNVGCARTLLGLAAGHVSRRRQFGRTLASFGLVQEKLAWIATRLQAVEAMTYLTAGLEDSGAGDCALEHAVAKIMSTEFVVGAANRALDLRGGAGYTRDEPYERILRDVRVFPIFEGSNDVLRGWVALMGMRAALERMVSGETVPPGDGGKFPDLSEQAGRLYSATTSLLTEYGEAMKERQLDQRRVTDAASELYAQCAVRSQLGSTTDELAIAAGEAFCAASASRLTASLRETESHDDERTAHLAALVCANEAGSEEPTDSVISRRSKGW